MLNLFLDESWISSRLSKIPLLYPFFGTTIKAKNLFQKEVFTHHGFDKKYYCLVNSKAKADLAVMPHDFWTLQKYDTNRLLRIINDAAKMEIKLLVDATGDRTEDINIENLILLRHSSYRSSIRDNEIVIPGYSQDLFDDFCDKKIYIRNKEQTPSVAFTGWAKINWQKDKLLYILSLIQFRNTAQTKGIFLRQAVIKNLSNSSCVRTSFNVRDSYSARTDTISLDPVAARKQFIQNILENDYSLCVRGEGNYSVRFYETLSLGRIPVVIDTDTVFPLENKINYHNFCLFIPLNNIAKIDSLIYNYNLSQTNSEYKERQKLARLVFEKYLRLDSYTPFLMKEIKKRL